MIDEIARTGVSAVWKFALPFPGADQFSIPMPASARLLGVQIQAGSPQVWALVRPENITVERHFRIAGTGHPIEESVKAYVGTFQIAGGSLVFHLFEVHRA